MKRWLPVCFFLLIFLFFLHPFDNNGDFYHHIDTGRWILENRALPQVDSFTHTRLGQPWVAHSWASGVLFYLIFESFGPLGISLFVSLVATLTFGLLFLLLRSYGVSAKISLLTIFLTLGPVSTRFLERPEIFSYPLLLSLLLIDQLRTKKPNLSLIFPLIILVWANFYGSSVILGLGLLGLFVVKQIFQDKFKITKSNYLFYIFILSAFPLSLLNGYGFRTIFYLFLYIPQVRVYEGEWLGLFQIIQYLPQSYLLSIQSSIIIYGLFLITVLTICLLKFKKLKSQIFFTILGVAILLPIQAFRQLPTAVFLVAPLVAILLGSFSKRPIIYGILTISIIMISLSSFADPPGLSIKDDLSKNAMVELIKSHQVSGKAFNHTHFGGFLTFQFYPQILTFIDTRDELYTNSEVLNDLYQTYSSNASVQPLLDKYRVDLVFADILTDNLNYRDLLYSSKWSLVFFSDRYMVLTTKETAKKYDLAVINSIDPFSQTGAKPGMEEKAQDYYSKLPPADNNRNLIAKTEFALGQDDKAIQTLSAISISPFAPLTSLLSADKDYLLTEIYLDKKDCENANKHFDHAESSSQGVFSFNPPPTPPFVIKVRAFYALVCGKDFSSARTLLENYLAQPDVSPLEKTKALKEFNDLSR